MTDLDATVLSRAVILALAMIDLLPDEHRRPGDRDDLVYVLCMMVQDPAERERLARDVERQTGQLVDITDWSGRDWMLE
jgi:hypothetical protein